MENKISYIQAISVINLIHTPRYQGNWKNKAEPRKIGLRLFPMDVHSCVSFRFDQNANHALGSWFKPFLNQWYINRYIKANIYIYIYI